MWKALNAIKDMTTLKAKKHATPYLAQDLVWLPIDDRDQVEEVDLPMARRLHHRGVSTWSDVWNNLTHSWALDQELKKKA